MKALLVHHPNGAQDSVRVWAIVCKTIAVGICASLPAISWNPTQQS